MTQEEQYKSFIKYCTKAGKSISNYSDFKRINETIAKIKGVEKYDIYSCVHTKELQDMIDLLYENEEFKAYNTKGSNQYSNALETYLKFLHAKEIFAEETKPKYSPILSLQQIYYGAPGTGKSKAIKDLTFGESVIRTTFHPDSDYASFVGTYKPITEEVLLRDCYGKKVIDDETKEVVKEERIAYKFIPQAFLEAYVEAWKKLGSGKKQYLIIEEINRGNCAQIFGDLFQLLDRNEYGFSDYPIVADKDMQKYLKNEFEGWEITNKDEINQLYGSLTNSEDKKLGYFFCKAKDGEIDADLFVSKVIFYLWNDVFKDYGFDDKDFQDEEGKILSFDRFYQDVNGKANVDIAIVEQFLENLGVDEFIPEKGEEEENIDAAPSNNETKGNDNTKYKLNGSNPLGKGELGISIIKQYLNEHPEMKYSEIKETFPDTMLGKDLKLIGLIVTRQEIENSSVESYKKRAYGFYKKNRKFYSSDGVEFYVSNWWNKTNIDSIIKFAKEQGWTVETIK